MRAVIAAAWAVGCWLAVTPARADISIPPRPMWGTPGPRTLVREGRRRPVPLVHRGPGEGGDVEEPERDPRVRELAETLELVFLRNLVWVRSRVVLRAVGEPVESWAMGIGDHAYRSEGLPLHFLAVRVDGEPAPVFERTIPYSAPGSPEDAGRARPGWDGWTEWRVSLSPDRDTVVEVEYVRPARWLCAEGGGIAACPPHHVGPFVGVFPFHRAEAARYRDGPSELTLVARAAGLDPRFERVEHVDGGPTLVLDGPRPPPRVTPLTAGEETTIGPGAPPAFEVHARVDALPDAASPESVPAWLALLDRSLRAGDFRPTLRHPYAPGYDAQGWEARAEELLELAASPRPREAGIARGLLAAIRTRLLATVSPEGWRSEEDADPTLPAPWAVGRFGAELDRWEWAEEVERAAAWLTPPGEEAPTVELEREPEWIEEARAGKRAPDQPAELSTEELLGQIDERYQRPTSSGARQRNDVASARAIGLEIGPPFGRPNQLVLAARGRRAGWELPAVFGTLTLLALGFWWVRRRRRRATARG